jgi:hypothetical protein
LGPKAHFHWARHSGLKFRKPLFFGWSAPGIHSEMFDGFMRRRRLERPLLILLALARVQLWEPARAQAGLVYADGQSKVNIVFMEPGQVEAAPKGGRARPPQSSAMHSTIMTPHDEYRLHLNDPQFVAGMPEISDGPQPNGQGQAEGDRRPGAASRSPLRGIRVICQRFPGLYSRKSCI